MFEEPELHMINVPPDPAWRAERDRQRAEGRRRHRDRVTLTLVRLGLPAPEAADWSEAIVTELFEVTTRQGGEPCGCSCHPRLPASDFHDYGFACSCQRRAEERRRSWDEFQRKQEAYARSPEGLLARAHRQVEEDELMAWLAGQADVVISSYGGYAPEQWTGSVGGRSFYFRERHDCWRIELDLRPSGRFTQTWRGCDLDSPEAWQPREIEEGDVIAEGVVDVPGYGTTPVERAEFLVGTIRDHVRRQACQRHGPGLADLERLLGRRPSWCPECGTRLG